MIVREVPGDGADRSRQGALLPVEKREREEEEEEKKKKKEEEEEERERERERKVRAKERCPTSFLFAPFFCLMAA